jgi:hypothetical protein
VKGDRRKKNFAFERAKAELHQVAFEMYRMFFDVTNALMFSATRDKDLGISDRTFYHLKLQAQRVVQGIEKAEEHLKPYIKKTLKDPPV